MTQFVCDCGAKLTDDPADLPILKQIQMRQTNAPDITQWQNDVINELLTGIDVSLSATHTIAIGSDNTYTFTIRSKLISVNLSKNADGSTNITCSSCGKVLSIKR